MATKHKGGKIETDALDAYIALKRAANAVAVSVNRHVADHKLTTGQFGIMEALFHLGPLRQKDLSKKILSTQGNLTMIIDNLEKQSLVQRGADPSDRRVTIVQLTEKGKALIESIFPQHVQNITALFSKLNEGELAELKRICKKLGLSITN